MAKRGRPPKYIGVDKEIRRLYNSKKWLKAISFVSFKEWYNNKNGCCTYCGLTSAESLMLFYKYPNATRKGRRGKRLELDRIKPDLHYGADINNLALACYWCNNAKTNYFTYDEFIIIGDAIGKIQKNRLLDIENK